jgi:uncharacterized membrane protein YjdF
MQRLLLIVVIVGEVVLGISPKADRVTWVLENAPVFILLPLIVLLQPKLKLSMPLLVVLSFHAFVLMLGGHYTYAEVPLGNWVKDAFSFARNHYDRLGISCRDSLLRLRSERFFRRQASSAVEFSSPRSLFHSASPSAHFTS